MTVKLDSAENNINTGFFFSPEQELQAHTHTTDDNDIRQHTVQEHNERTSTEFNLVTA